MAIQSVRDYRMECTEQQGGVESPSTAMRLGTKRIGLSVVLALQISRFAPGHSPFVGDCCVCRQDAVPSSAIWNGRLRYPMLGTYEYL